MSAGSRARSWSLARRITWGFGLSGALLALAIVGIHAAGAGESRWLFVLLALALATSVGALVGGRVSGLLRGTASRIRGMRMPSDALELEDGGGPQEVRELIEALRGKLLEVRGMTKSARLMSSGLGHELRSPLQNLIGEIDLALVGAHEPGEYRRILRGQKEELHKLGRMVENLLALCAAHESHANGVAERFDLGVEAEIRLAWERELAGGRDVRLSIDHLGSLECEGDRETVVLVLRNLVTNAIEASPEGGAVHVLITGERDSVAIVVDDSGAGPDPQEHNGVLGPMRAGRNGGSAGQALSLALTKQALEIHRGTIEATPSPLGGMRFSVSLPRLRS